jgi:hypothetical protein
MNTEIEELTRDDLLALLADLGGYGSSNESLRATDDETLVAIVRNRLNLVVDMARIEAALMRSLPLDWRARLTMRRGELEQAAKAVRDAAAGRQPPKGNIVVVVPTSVGISHLYGAQGRIVCSRVADDGQLVLDLFMHEFKNLLADRRDGLAWHNSNPEAVRQMGELAR